VAQALLLLICNGYDEASIANPAEVVGPQAGYGKCQVGDVEVGKRLARALDKSLAPSPKSRRSYERERGLPNALVFWGSGKARREAQKTRAEVWQALKLYRPKEPAPSHAAYCEGCERA
jgi:hypothetical protein